MKAAIVALILALIVQDAQAQVPAAQPIGDSSVAVTDAESETSSPLTEQEEQEEVDLGRGFAIAFTGMTIVAVALVLILGFISALPRVLAALEPYLPEPAHHHGAAPKSHPESQVAEDEAVLAAIGYVLHTRMQQKS